MFGHVIVERRADVVFKSRIALRLTDAAKRAESAESLRKRAQKPWISEEEAARLGRRRTLLDDNPASG